MKSIVTVALTIFGLVASISVKADFETRIVGGVKAQEGEIPYIVSLQANGWNHFCGGSLIGSRWILTAAHCVFENGQLGGVDSVWVGLYDQSHSKTAEKIKPYKIYPHPKYNPNPEPYKGTHDYDFALIELSQNSSRKPIKLNMNNISVTVSQKILAMTAGWGTLNEDSDTTPDILRKVTVPLVTNADCSKDPLYKGKITDRMLCAGYKVGGKDSCQGDSGGPLVMNQNGNPTLIGVVSWGVGCAQKNRYGVYSKVSSVYNWISTVSGIK